ncbi:hypothetical protein N7540_008262 [Penicillium herquei]|nr:hypothetical protein N7540_008262 [Penicillium herquei]
MAKPEAMEDVQMSTTGLTLDIESLKRKKFKADDLPLSGSQHAAIDKLLHSFKKKGGFDSIRKKIWAEFNDGEFKTKFTDELLALAESEIEREPAHLSRERRKAATLIEGAVDRSDVYNNVELSIDKLTSAHLESVLGSVRDIRRQDIGDEAASKEEQAGNKTDAEYEAYVKSKRDEREKVWREEMRKQKEIDDEQKRIRDEERRKKRELERKKEDEERARRRELDDQRRAERERLRKEQRALDDQRERERDERYERRRQEERDRYRDRDRSRTRDRDRDRDRDRYRERERSPAYRSDRPLSPRSRDLKREKSAISKDPTPAPAPVDEKSLEEAALQMLLKEGEELAAKARQKPEFDFEEAEAIENGLKPPASASGQTKDLHQTGKTGHELMRGAEVEVEALIVDDVVLGLAIVTVKWTNDVATGISETKEATGRPVAAVVDQSGETVTETETELDQDPELLPDHDPDPAIETTDVALTAVGIEVEIVIVSVSGIMMNTVLAADLLHVDVHALDPVTVSENSVLALALRYDGDHALVVLLHHEPGELHPALSISTVMYRLPAIAANHLVAECGPLTVTVIEIEIVIVTGSVTGSQELGLAKSIDTCQDQSARSQKKKRRRQRLQQT